MMWSEFGTFSVSQSGHFGNYLPTKGEMCYNICKMQREAQMDGRELENQLQHSA